jgi:hypothetical protein
MVHGFIKGYSQAYCYSYDNNVLLFFHAKTQNIRIIDHISEIIYLSYLEKDENSTTLLLKVKKKNK